MNPNLRDLANQTKNPEVSLDAKPSNTIYVPSIDLYVSENIEMQAVGFWDAREKLKEIGARILTPAQWWKFYDYCEQNCPDLIEDFEIDLGEWLNLYVSNEQKVAYEIAPDSVSKMQKKIYLPNEAADFNREHINSETGMPDAFTSGGDWYFSMSGADTALARCCFQHQVNTKGEFVFLDVKESHMYVGVRLCYRK
jgi:hypothetical protein